MAEVEPFMTPDEKPFILFLEVFGTCRRSDISGDALLFNGVFNHAPRALFRTLWEECEESHSSNFRPVTGGEVLRCDHTVRIAQSFEDIHFVREIASDHPFGFHPGLLTLIALKDGKRVGALVANRSVDSRGQHRACWRVFREDYQFLVADAVFVNRIYAGPSPNKRQTQRALLTRLVEISHNIPARPLTLIEGVSYEFHPVAISMGFRVRYPQRLKTLSTTSN